MIKALGAKPSKGFLITCDRGRQKKAFHEAIALLASAIQMLHPQLAAVENKLFSQIKTDVQCIVFIGIRPAYDIISPQKVVYFLTSGQNQSQFQAKFCHRITPSQRTFQAQFFRMKQNLEQLIQKQFQGQQFSWMLNFKCRNNNKFNIGMALQIIQNQLKDKGHWVDLNYPMKTISVIVSHHLMCVSITEHFKERRQYALKKGGVFKPKFEGKVQPARVVQKREDWQIYNEVLFKDQENQKFQLI